MILTTEKYGIYKLQTVILINKFKKRLSGETFIINLRLQYVEMKTTFLLYTTYMDITL